MSSVIKSKGFEVENLEKNLKIYVKSKLKVYEVVGVGKAVIEREEFCASKFKFTVKKDSEISFNQGDAISVKLGDEGLFFGYVFSKSRDKNELIEVIAYDQVRYMKNKVCYSRGTSTLTEVIYSLGSRYGFNLGEVDKCNTMLLPMAGENVALLDVVKKGCKTAGENGEKYILFDNFGYLYFKNEKDLYTDVLIDATQSENYVYTDTIDKNVYNKVVLYVVTKGQGAVKAYEYEDKESVEKWGELIITKKLTGYSDANEGQSLLKEYSRINREIVLKGVLGNNKIIPGSRVYVKMIMGDIYLDGFMRVKKAVHIFENNLYKADVYLDGSEID